MAFAPSPALFKPSQMRLRPVAVHFVRGDPSHCFEFIWKRTNGDASETYICRGCHAVKKLAAKNPAAFIPPPGSVPSVKILNDNFMEDPENPNHPHFCEMYEAPAAMMRREELIVCQGLRTSHDDRTPGEVEQELLDSLDKPEYALFNGQERLEMVEAMTTGTGNGKKNLARQIQRNKRTVVNGVNQLVPGQIDRNLTQCAADQEQFILKDEPECLVLGSRHLIRTVFSSLRPIALLSDGRFKQVPNVFAGPNSQVYTIFAEIDGNHAVILMVAIMKGTSERDYDKVFRVLYDELQLNGLLLALRPLYFLCDFELAAMTSAAKTFNMLVRGCWFHFTQALQRNQPRGAWVKDNPYVSRYFDRLRAIPFIPPSLIGFSGVLAYPRAPLVTAQEELVLAEFHLYLERTWLEPQGRFASLWSHNENYGPRTTNIVEGHHSAMSQHYRNVRNPRLDDLLMHLKNDITLAKSTLNPLYHQQHPGRHRRPAEINHQQRIHDAMRQFALLRRQHLPGNPPPVTILAFLDELRRFV